MGKNPRSSSLLDQLRAQSDAVRKQEGEQHRPVEEALRHIDRELWKTFRWLDEALHHLEVIRPRVQRDFQLLGVLTLKSPRYDKGFITYRRRALANLELLEHVELFYRLVADAPVVLKVQPGAASGIEDRLRAANLQYRYETELDEYRVVRNGVFTIAPEINATVRFEPDFRRQRIEVSLRNVDRFESVILDFGADALGEPTLEDLVRLMLGEGNQFLRRAPLAGVGTSRAEAAGVARPNVSPRPIV